MPLLKSRCGRPTFSEFTGQVKVRERLELMVEAAKKRGDVLEHILLSGPPGLGKTTLAYIIANAMGVNIKNTSGPVIEKAGELAGLLTSLEKGDVLFIDEIHRLQPTIEEYLYPAMEDYRLDIIIDQGPQARSLRLQSAEVYADWRDDARRDGERAASFSFRHDSAARLLQRRGDAENHYPQRAFARRRDRRSRRGRDRYALTRHAAHREQSSALGARLRAGESRRENHR